MIRKSERPFNFSDEQIAHLKHIHPRLRTLNRYAICELRRIGWAILTDAQYRDSGKFLGTLSIRMNTLVRARDGILSAGQNQQPQLIEIVINSREGSDRGAGKTKVGGFGNTDHDMIRAQIVADFLLPFSEMSF